MQRAFGYAASRIDLPQQDRWITATRAVRTGFMGPNPGRFHLIFQNAIAGRDPYGRTHFMMRIDKRRLDQAIRPGSRKTIMMKLRNSEVAQ